MGGWRPRLLVIGLLAMVAVLLTTRTASSEPAGHHVVRGEVVAGAGGGDEWRVDQLADDRYRVVFLRPAELDVTDWDGNGDVVVTPLGRGVTEVRFDHRAGSGFTFVALVENHR